MPTIGPITYRHAFIRYLRKGTPIELSLKANERISTHYIWLTQGDDKVRPEHAVNEGRIFAWDSPPATGHPGTADNCRCTAAPYYGLVRPDDPPLEPVYPELILLPLLRIGRDIIALANYIVGQTRSTGKINKPDNLTEHGAVRFTHRRISKEETQEAIATAKETGNTTIKTGKYGTDQIHYRGSNGVTVIIETSGRNAGKIITFWRHQ